MVVISTNKQLTSGIKCSEKVLEDFSKMLKQRKYRYIIYRIPSGGQSSDIMVEKASTRNATFNDFVHDLPKNEAR